MEQVVAKKRWFDWTWLMVILLIGCAPVGFYPLWKSKRYRLRTKLIVTAVIVIWFGSVIMSGMATQGKVEEANELWLKGQREEAITLYREALSSDFITDIAREDRPLVFQRVVEFDVANGDLSSAKQYIARAVSFDTPLAFNSPDARALYDQVIEEKRYKEAQDMTQDFLREAARNLGKN